jgi:hypothetical protein
MPSRKSKFKKMKKKLGQLTRGGIKPESGTRSFLEPGLEGELMIPSNPLTLDLT